MYDLIVETMHKSLIIKRYVAFVAFLLDFIDSFKNVFHPSNVFCIKLALIIAWNIHLFIYYHLSKCSVTAK